MEINVKLEVGEYESLMARARTVCRRWAGFHTRKSPHAGRFGNVHVVETSCKGEHFITKTALELGIDLTLRVNKNALNQIMGDACITSIDAPVLDSIVQYAIFGALLYD